jgi:hypothetical protein
MKCQLVIEMVDRAGDLMGVEIVRLIRRRANRVVEMKCRLVIETVDRAGAPTGEKIVRLFRRRAMAMADQAGVLKDEAKCRLGTAMEGRFWDQIGRSSRRENDPVIARVGAERDALIGRETTRGHPASTDRGIRDGVEAVSLARPEEMRDHDKVVPVEIHRPDHRVETNEAGKTDRAARFSPPCYLLAGPIAGGATVQRAFSRSGVLGIRTRCGYRKPPPYSMRTKRMNC